MNYQFKKYIIPFCMLLHGTVNAQPWTSTSISTPYDETACPVSSLPSCPSNAACSDWVQTGSTCTYGAPLLRRTVTPFGYVTLDANNINKKVGIGTATPNAKLEVAGSGGGAIDFIVNGRMQSNNNDGGLWVASDRFIGGHSTNKIGFFNGGAWQLTVQNDGKVGIGTTSPLNQLSVVNKSSFGGNAAVSYEPIEAQGSYAGLSLYDRIGGSAERWVVYSARTGAANTNTLRFWTGSTDIMSISPNGNVNIIGQLSLADVYGAGGKNLLIGDDAYLTDIDQTNILGIYGNANSDRAGIKLGSSGPTLFGVNSNLDVSGSINLNKYARIRGNGGNATIFMGDNTDNYDRAVIAMDGNNTLGINLNLNTDPSNYNGVWNRVMTFNNSGKVIIGGFRTNPSSDAKLTVDGTIYATKVVVTSTFADYVFENQYKLKELDEVEKYIIENKRLPNMPSTCEIENIGMNLADIVKLQMEKIEELTLYIIKIKKDINAINQSIKK